MVVSEVSTRPVDRLVVDSPASGPVDYCLFFTGGKRRVSGGVVPGIRALVAWGWELHSNMGPCGEGGPKAKYARLRESFAGHSAIPGRRYPGGQVPPAAIGDSYHALIARTCFFLLSPSPVDPSHCPIFLSPFEFARVLLPLDHLWQRRSRTMTAVFDAADGKHPVEARLDPPGRLLTCRRNRQSQSTTRPTAAGSSCTAMSTT